jgi:NitT/TauT family transport system substrate-binding protein
MQRRNALARLTASAALAGCAPWLAGCGEAQPLRVGIHPWVGYETLFLAREFKWLSPSVQLQPMQEVSATSVALQAGDIDAGCLTLDEVLRLRSLGAPVTVGLVFDVSAGADMVVASAAIKRPVDLAGKRIGVEPGALGSLMLQGLLKQAQLSKSAVNVVELPFDQQIAAWRNRSVDAIICFEPNATMLQRDGAQRIFDSRQLPDTILDVLAVRSDRGDRLNGSLRVLLQGHFKGLGHLQANRQDAIYRIAARQHLTPKEVQQALAGVVMPTLEANRQYLAPVNNRLDDAAKRVSGLMVQGGLLPREDSQAGLSTGVWLPRDDG